jgi:hypothetical protein
MGLTQWSKNTGYPKERREFLPLPYCNIRKFKQLMTDLPEGFLGRLLELNRLLTSALPLQKTH